MLVCVLRNTLSCLFLTLALLSKWKMLYCMDLKSWISQSCFHINVISYPLKCWKAISLCHLLHSVHMKQEQPDLGLQCLTSKTFQQTTKTCDWPLILKAPIMTAADKKTFCDIFLKIGKNKIYCFICFVWFDSFRPINNLSVIKGRVFLGWTSTKLGVMFLLKDRTQWRRWCSNPQPFGLESSTLPLSHSVVNQMWYFELRDVWASFRYIYRVVFENVQKGIWNRSENVACLIHLLQTLSVIMLLT